MNPAVAALAIHQTPNDEELAEIQRRVGGSANVSTLVDVDGVAAVHLILAGNLPVDLSAAPAGKVTRLVVQTQPQTQDVTLTGLGPDSVVEIKFPDRPSNRFVTELRLDDCQGQVRVAETMRAMRIVCTSPQLPEENAHQGEEGNESGNEERASDEPPTTTPSVVAQEGADLTVRKHLNGTVPILDGGNISVGTTIERLLVRRGSIDLPGDDRGGVVREVAAIGEAELLLGPDVPTVLEITSADDTAKATLDLAASDDVDVRGIFHVNLTARVFPVVLSRVEVVVDAEIRGSIHLALNKHATVSQTSFVTVHDDDEVVNPTLTAAAGSFLLDVTGAVDIGESPGLHIAAGAGGLAINLAPDTPTEHPWQGAMMTNVELPRGLVGRQILDLLDDTYQFTPSTKNLPGRDQTFWARIRGKRETVYSDGATMQRQLYEDAEFMRELSNLCRKKGTPGSVATSVAWCSYRLRHIKAGGVENLALGVYRWLGYGERPLPAFALWAVLALLLAGPVLLAGGASFDPDGFGTFFAEVGRLALGPLAGLLRGGALSGGDLAEIAARALISIPLVTGALALRNYVKSER